MPRTYPAQTEGLTLVTCWCEAKFRHHPIDEILAGRTFSCGSRCRPPK